MIKLNTQKSFFKRLQIKLSKTIEMACFALVPLSFCFTSLLQGEEVEQEESGYSINFNDVPIIEFIRFVSKVSSVNFIFNNEDLKFNITLATGKAVSPDGVLKALLHMLRFHGLVASEQESYYVIHKVEEGMSSGYDDSQDSMSRVKRPRRPKVQSKPLKENGVLVHNLPCNQETDSSAHDEAQDSEDNERSSRHSNAESSGYEDNEFFVHKLQYHQGSEIEEAMKKIAADLKNQGDVPERLIQAIQSMQWIKTTNSLLCSADPETIVSIKKLVNSLDIPLRQVFIEVLVIETDVKKSMEFGLQWATGGQFSDKLAFGTGNFAPHSNPAFASTLSGINATNPPTGLDQFPVGNGFDLGVIGDIIMHKGKSYLTLGSLVSALQMDGDSTIVLNQKIITQDNKNSTIFVGDNIPFTGSVVQTIGQGQQTTANIEYRDIGVSLSITPMLGEGDIITLDLDEQITESLTDPHYSNATVNGIRTTKTNMVTHVHVPDKHFLVLSGMIRNAKSHHRSGLPCLGGLPVIGAAFSKTREQDEKRNMIIFVRPHIIHSFDEYKQITHKQEELYKSQAPNAAFSEGVKLVSEE